MDNNFSINASEEDLLLNPDVSIISSSNSRGATPVVLTITVDHFKTSERNGAADKSQTYNVVAEEDVRPVHDGIQTDGHGGMAENGQAFIGRSHCHTWPEESRLDKKARRRLIIASLLCLTFMIAEVVGGFLAHSLAVMSDAAHLLTDFASFMISLMALYLVSRPSTKRLSFGWYRAEILGALVSILMLWVITGVLVYSGVQRIESGDYEINATIMLITSGTGVFFNIVLAVSLHQHDHGHGHSHSHGHGHSHGSSDSIVSKPNSPLLPSENGGTSVSQYGSMRSTDGVQDQASTIQKSKKKASNINVQAAFIHVIGDLCQSVGVLVAAFIIYFKPEWKIADPICTFLFSVFVLITTLSIMRDILVVLMEGTPRNLSFEEVRATFLNLEGVQDLHDLRLWSLTMSKTALSVHLVVQKGVDPLQVVQAASFLIQQKFNISQTTMQVEEYVEEMDSCSQCQDLKD
ncbi:zinc transporter 2-like isoform X2 [Pomacea canaliculata]|uniref:zinc transporter 2-like isoform X2 n=1 Tax=Pomacea canaliculata TaxID=400727 RepID=UPI000D734B03|nr:zinc transporter 2-like isoform X2 [Pomacea canaliculata]